MNNQSCEMIRVADHEAVIAGPPGAFFIISVVNNDNQRYRHMWVKLPSGGVSALPLAPIQGQSITVPSIAPECMWQFDGNEEKPTLAPSVWQKGDKGWHGFIRAGRMESC
jgi:hypothetical protein